MPEIISVESEANRTRMSVNPNHNAMREMIDAEAVIRSTLNDYWQFLIKSGLPAADLPAYKLAKDPEGRFVVRILFYEEKVITWTLTRGNTSRVEVRDAYSYLKLNLHPYEVLPILKEYAY